MADSIVHGLILGLFGVVVGALICTYMGVPATEDSATTRQSIIRPRINMRREVIWTALSTSLLFAIFLIAH